MTELQSEEIKNAIVSQLLKTAPECAVYKEAQSAPEYPHFFIHLIDVSDEEERRKCHILTYLFDLRYRIKSDPSTDLNLEQSLDAMALKLLSAFNIVDCGDVKIRFEDKHYEKQDGVLHFFCKVKMMVHDRENTASTPFGGIELEIGLKGA
jgi:hypothetical protein